MIGGIVCTDCGQSKSTASNCDRCNRKVCPDCVRKFSDDERLRCNSCHKYVEKNGPDFSNSAVNQCERG
ncbi:hypothetical protein GOV04_02150 [Candidatus Woesearchaeota archaeon]|nr:hypothetical protein [Candidatus Woesearchaeota archaeon]